MNLPNPQWIVAVALALLIAGIIFSIPIDTVEEVETYYTPEPLTFEKSPEHERQVRRWIFWDATEVQYIIKNTDTIDGVFTLNFVFSNEKEVRSRTKKIEILTGAQKVVTEVSPLNGVSKIMLNVIPPNKLIPHERIVSKNVILWDRIWELTSIFGIR